MNKLYRTCQKSKVKWNGMEKKTLRDAESQLTGNTNLQIKQLFTTFFLLGQN